MTENVAITARGLKKIFNHQRVLDHLDLTIERGETIGLLGSNGAGKTTLLKSLLGLLAVDGGRCTVLGEPSTSLSPAARAQIAYVPQHPGQFAWLTGKAMLHYVSNFYPEVYEIGRTGPFYDRECRSRGCENRREPEHGSGDVYVAAEIGPNGREHAGAPPLRDASTQHVQHVRPRHQNECNGGQNEQQVMMHAHHH